jgi:DNA polymerase family B, exonuclease domain
VLVHLHNYEPYFYAAIPQNSTLIPSDLPDLKSKLNDIKKCIKNVEIVNKYPLMPYTDIKSRFIKITTNSPKNVTEMRGTIMIRCF